MKIRYIGKFPPPYGGVTIKNKLLYQELSGHIPIIRLKERKGIPSFLHQIANFMTAFFKNQRLVIGISSRGGKSKLMTDMLYYLNRRVMQESLYFMMGGTEANDVAQDKNAICQYSHYKTIFVETRRMEQCLIDAGLQNVSVFPNCRKRPGREYSPAETGRQMRCVFFSLISPDKGSDLVLEAAKALPDVLFDFYGHIEPGYEEPFRKQIDGLPNAVYHGLFKTEGENVYDKLHEYDLLLLPTKCKTEGVPGVLVEAKIAAVPAVVSDIAYNAEIIEDGRNGTVLSSNDAAALTQAIARLDADRETLYHLKTGAKTSAEQYYIESYLPEILGMLEEKE